MNIKTYLFNHDEYPKAKTPKTPTKNKYPTKRQSYDVETQLKAPNFIPIAPHHHTTQHIEGEHTKNQTDAAPGRNKNVAATAAIIYAKQGPDNNKKKHIANGQQTRLATNNHNIRTLHWQSSPKLKVHHKKEVNNCKHIDSQ